MGIETESGGLEAYPARIVVLSASVAILLYAVGATIVGYLWVWLAAAYLLFCAWVELNVLRKSCVHCYYYGKICGLGKGKLCSWLFRRGDPRRFVEREASWRELIPDMLVLVIPLVAGIVALILDFSWLLLGLLVLLLLLALGGNALVRGSFACKYCRQRELGCPAEKLFGGRDG